MCVELARSNSRLEELARQEPTIERLTTAPGVGLVVAAAFVSVVDEARRFDGAHQLESYLGLVPREASTGGKRKLGSITKQGNGYMRQLLVQSASSILRVGDPDDPLRRWGRELVARRGRKIAVVALARRLAGILWAMWRKGTVYEPARLGKRTVSGQDVRVEALAMKNAARKAHFHTRDTARTPTCARAITAEHAGSMSANSRSKESSSGTRSPIRKDGIGDVHEEAGDDEEQENESSSSNHALDVGAAS